MSCLKWSGPHESPPFQLRPRVHHVSHWKKGSPFYLWSNQIIYPGPGAAVIPSLSKGFFSDPWKLGKCPDEMLPFIMKASLRSWYFRAYVMSLFLFCNPISNTSCSKQQLTLISMWNWLAPGSLISKRVSCALACSLAWLEGGRWRLVFFGRLRGEDIQLVWDGGDHRKT